MFDHFRVNAYGQRQSVDAASQPVANTDATFSALLELAPDAIVVLDATSRITLVNRQATVVFGYSSHELVGSTVEMLMPERFRADHVTLRQGFVDAPRVRPMAPGLGLFGRRKDGTEFPAEISLGPVAIDGEQLVMAVVRDVTERRRAETEHRQLEAARTAHAEAEAASRAKDQFLANVSHELRTPLNAILGWARLLQAHPDREDIRNRAVPAIERNSRIQQQLIEDLLDSSRIVAGTMRLDRRPLSVSAVIEAAVEVVRPMAEEKGVSLGADVSANVGIISGDASRLQQVFWNLCANAVKFTPAGGHVQIAARRIEQMIEVTVTDDGEGIVPALLSTIFERFQQAPTATTGSRGGLGLGLAIAKDLVERHGGTVTAESDGLGRGSRFTVRLPG